MTWLRRSAGSETTPPTAALARKDRAHGPLRRLPSGDPPRPGPAISARAKLPPDILRGVVAWSGGAYDLVQKVADGGTYAPYIRQAFGESALAWRDASPVTHVFDAKPIPPLLFISVERGNSSHKAAERLAGLIRSAGGRADSLLLEGRTHFTANHLLGARKTPRGNCSSISSER